MSTETGAVSVRRVTLAIAAAGICSFTLLYAPQPLLPQLAEQYSLDPGRAALAISVATGALAVAVLPLAVLSEIVGRKPIIVASVLTSALLGLALPLAPTFEVFLAIRVLQGVAIAGFPGVASAYLAERLGTAGVAAAVGAMIAGNTIGGLSGRLSVGWTTDALGWHGALAVVGGIGLVCAVVTTVTLPGLPPRARRPKLGDVGRGLATAVGDRTLLAQYAVALLAMGSFVALYNVAGFRLTGDLGLSPAIASLVFLAYAGGAVASSRAGRLVARLGRVRAASAGLVLTIAGAALTLPDSVPLVAAGFVVLTMGFFTAHSVANGWAAAEAPAAGRGQVGGLYNAFYYLGSSIGGAIGAYVYGHAGWGGLVATVSAWLALGVAAVLTTRLRSRTVRPSEHEQTAERTTEQGTAPEGSDGFGHDRARQQPTAQWQHGRA
ncbi:MFS transporter [Prauserella rugosa]|uniref:YNFM family putative membrane transporter n=1 Tax=Prauserella rugosa TaxID=43354 RepID=A0A660CFX8_9PSEU|nr:MFS transporter [Prauserella rugosa]TWH22478.1 YNFM family putative membrane transporter [Prauserella rugosa]